MRLRAGRLVVVCGHMCASDGIGDNTVCDMCVFKWFIFYFRKRNMIMFVACSVSGN